MRKLGSILATGLVTLSFLGLPHSDIWGSPSIGQGATGTASYYTRASCLREGTSGVMANGKELDDNENTCATWGYPFGTRLDVRNLENGKVVSVEVTDRGPNKKLYKKGRIIDLSKRAFSQLALLEQGIIKVEITEVVK